MQDENNHLTIRRSAGFVLADFKDERAIDFLKAELQKPRQTNYDFDDAARVARALGKYRTTQTIEIIANQLMTNFADKNGVWKLLDTLTYELSNSGDLGIDYLLIALQSSNPLVRIQTAHNLSRAKSPRVVTALAAMLNDTEQHRSSNQRVCDAVLQTLQRINTPEAQQAILQWRETHPTENPEVRKNHEE